MVGSPKQGLPSWVGMATAKTKVEIDKSVVREESTSGEPSATSRAAVADGDLSFGERAFSAAGAAFISAIIVNPLDVAKTRLQAQAARVPYDNLQSTCTSTNIQHSKYRNSSVRTALGSQPLCSSECTHYRGTLDVFYKVIREEGFSRLWRGTNASLALAIPSVGIYMPLYDMFRIHMEEFTSENAPSMTTYVPLVAGSLARSIACVTCYPVELARTRMQAFKHDQAGVKPPGVLKTLVGIVPPMKSPNIQEIYHKYRMLWTGFGAQLARDVPFSAVCWALLEPLRRKMLSNIGDEASGPTILGANFCAGFVAGSIAAAATCPLDVARTRRQIEKDPTRALNMTTRHTLVEVWRDRGLTGLFTGMGPRVARTGPSVGIVVSVYEVVKYALHFRHTQKLLLIERQH